MENTLVFIDAAFLSKLNKYFGNERYIKYDLFKLCDFLAKKQNLFCKQIFYYTAPPFQSTQPKNEERIRKENYDKFIKKLLENKTIIIREGRCQRIKNDSGDFEFNQKGVDTLVTMDLMSVPLLSPDIKTIILIACDSDFVPVIEKLKSLGVKIILYTYYDKGRKSRFSTSNELIKIVNRYVLLRKDDLLNCALEKV